MADVLNEENNNDAYEVEKIIKFKIRKDNVYYLIRWKGYGPEADSWEPEENLQDCDEVLHDFIKHMGDETKKTPSKKTRYLKSRTPQMKIIHPSFSPPPSPSVKAYRRLTTSKAEMDEKSVDVTAITPCSPRFTCQQFTAVFMLVSLIAGLLLVISSRYNKVNV